MKKIQGQPTNNVSNGVANEELRIHALITANANLAQACSQKTAKSTTQRSGTVEQANAEEHLMSRVEHSQIDDDSTE